MDDLETLLKRVEAATGPDRRLADDVMLACGWRQSVGDLDDVEYEAEDGTLFKVSYDLAANDALWHPPGAAGKSWIHGHVRPDPTARLDATLALVEDKLPGSGWSRAFDGYFYVNEGCSISKLSPSYASRPLANDALTCVAALLRALSTQSDTGKE